MFTFTNTRFVIISCLSVAQTIPPLVSVSTAYQLSSSRCGLFSYCCTLARWPPGPRRSPQTSSCVLPAAPASFLHPIYRPNGTSNWRLLVPAPAVITCARPGNIATIPLGDTQNPVVLNQHVGVGGSLFVHTNSWISAVEFSRRSALASPFVELENLIPSRHTLLNSQPSS